MTEPSKKERRRQLFEHDLLPEHLQAIGTVAVRSALLDLMIEQTAENITKSYPKTVRKRLQSLSVPRQLDMIGEMLTAQLRGDKFGIEDFIRDVHQAREDRAEIMHSLWRKGETAEVRHLLDPRAWKPKKPAKSVTPASMLELSNRIIDLTFELADWKMRAIHVFRHHTSIFQGKSPPPPGPPPPRASHMDEPKHSV